MSWQDRTGTEDPEAAKQVSGIDAFLVMSALSEDLHATSSSCRTEAHLCMRLCVSVT